MLRYPLTNDKDTSCRNKVQSLYEIEKYELVELTVSNTVFNFLKLEK